MAPLAAVLCYFLEKPAFVDPARLNEWKRADSSSEKDRPPMARQGGDNVTNFNSTLAKVAKEDFTD